MEAERVVVTRVEHVTEPVVTFNEEFLRDQVVHGIVISDDAKTYLEVRDQLRDQREQDTIAAAREAKKHYLTEVDGYRQAQDELLQAAQDLLLQHASVAAWRASIESSFRTASRLGVSDLQVPPRISIRVQSEREHRYLVAQLKSSAWGDV